MKRVIVACVGVFAAAGSAMAADVLPRYQTPFYNPGYSWTGFYLGINGGGGWGRSQWDGIDRFDVSGGLIGGRLGYALDRFLPYLTGGLAVGDINATLPGFPAGSITTAGWTVGAGLEFGIVSNVSVKAEYLYVDLGNFNCGLNCALAPTGNVSFNANLFRAGANVRF